MCRVYEASVAVCQTGGDALYTGCFEAFYGGVVLLVQTLYIGSVYRIYEVYTYIYTGN